MNTGSYVNGKWYHPNSREISRNINPADTSDVIAEFPLATAADVRMAVDAATAAFGSWKKTPGPERGRVLWRAADIARRRLDEIARTLTREEGKILKEAKGEVLKRISSAARKDMESLFGGKVYLGVWVKVKRDWTGDERLLRQLGYR